MHNFVVIVLTPLSVTEAICTSLDQKLWSYSFLWLLQQTILFSLIQYQILIASMLMFLGCPSSCLGVPSQFSGVQLLSNDSSAEEGRGDQLPQSHDNAKSQDPRGSIDKLTGKRIIQASDRVNLYLPGRILHITARKGKG